MKAGVTKYVSAAQEILDRLHRAPVHVRKLQAEWKHLAEDVLRRT